jgi:hypothetical protein
MGVTPIGHRHLTQADVRAIIAHSAAVLDQGVASACLPVETDDGELVVALVGCDGESLLCAFGKDQGWYYVTDPEGVPMAHGRLIDEVLTILSHLEAQCPPQTYERRSHG